MTWSEEMGEAWLFLCNAYRRNRYASDPAYRERRLRVTPEQRKRQAELRRQRYHADPEYRERRRAQAHKLKHEAEAA